MKFQNGVLVPTSKVEKEAVKMGRSVHNEIRSDFNTAQKATESGKHYLISQNSSSTSMPLASLASPKRKSAGVSSGFPL